MLRQHSRLYSKDKHSSTGPRTQGVVLGVREAVADFHGDIVRLAHILSALKHTQVFPVQMPRTFAAESCGSSNRLPRPSAMAPCSAPRRCNADPIKGMGPESTACHLVDALFLKLVLHPVLLPRHHLR
jgi:hypothetical protein